jgi:HEAT repeat protein
MDYIFLSFHPRDVRFVDLLAEKIEQETTLELWLDEKRLQGELTWNPDVDQAIGGSDVILVVVSPEAKASDVVTYEWATALALNKPVILLLFRNTSLHPRLALQPQISFQTSPRWDELFQALADSARPHDEALAAEPGQEDVLQLDEAVRIPVIVRRAEEMLNSLNPAERESAIENLVSMDHPAARDLLARVASEHPSKNVRIRAAEALVQMHDDRAVPGLLEGLQDEDYDKQWDAAWALVQMGGDETVEGLLQAMRNPDARRVAAWALGEIGEPAKAGLVRALYDSEPMVRFAASDALARVGAIAIPELLAALRGSNDNVRADAARSLTRIGEPAVPGLVESLRYDDMAVRRAAGSALMEMGDVAVPALERSLRNPDRKIVREVRQILQRIGTSRAMDAMSQWRQNQDDS